MSLDSSRVCSLDVGPSAGSTLVLHPVVITTIEEAFVTKLFVKAPFSLQIDWGLVVITAAVTWFTVSTIVRAQAPA